MLNTNDGLCATDMLAAYPRWYALICSGGLRRAVTNHIVEMNRLDKQLQWGSKQVEMVKEGLRSPPTLTGPLGGLTGNGTFASERLVVAEAQYRGVAPATSYGQTSAILQAQGTRNSSTVRPNSAKFIHLSEGSRRNPLQLASPSFLAGPSEVFGAAAKLLQVQGPAATRNQQSGHRGSSRPLPSSQSLTHVPVRKSHSTSSTRELLLQKASAIAIAISSGQLYVSPMTGSSASPHAPHPRSPSSQRKSGPQTNQEQLPSPPTTFATKVGRGWQSRSITPPTGLKVQGAVPPSATLLKNNAEASASAVGVASNDHQTAVSSSSAVMALLSHGAFEVTQHMAASTAELLLHPLKGDMSVNVVAREYSIVPNGDETSVPRDPVLIRSFSITGAKANDSLVAAARKEIRSIDEAASVLEDGPIEYQSKQLARKVVGEQLGLAGAEAEAEWHSQQVPLVEGSCRLVAIRSALAYNDKEALTLLEVETIDPDAVWPLREIISWMWEAFRWADKRLNGYLPMPLRATVKAGNTAADRREAEVQRGITVSAAVLEAFLSLTFDLVCGGGLYGVSDVVESPSTQLANELADILNEPLSALVQKYSEPTHGYEDQRSVLLNSQRMVIALKAALSTLLDQGVASQTASRRTVPHTDTTVLESGTELIPVDDDKDEGTFNNEPADSLGHSHSSFTDNQLALLLLVLLSRIPMADVVERSVAIMQPLWDRLAVRDRREQSRSSIAYQPPHIGSPDAKNTFLPPQGQRRPGTAAVGSPSLRTPARSSTSVQRPVTASSLKRLVENPHRSAAVAADEVIARLQKEEELASPLPSVGVTRRDPLTRVNAEEYNLERVMMSRLSRRLLSGEVTADSSPAMVSPQKAARPATPTQPSNLTKLLNDVHLQPSIERAPGPIISDLTVIPNRLGNGGSIRNNAIPPFVTETQATTYRTQRGYNELQSPGAMHPSEVDSHFVQYLKSGIIAEDYQRQLAHAHPFVMNSLKRAAAVAADSAASGGATDLRDLFQRPNFEVSPTARGFQHGTRLQSATRQRQFQDIQEYIIDPQDRKEASQAGNTSQDQSKARRDSRLDSIVLSSGTDLSPSRPASGNCFSRVPHGYGWPATTAPDPFPSERSVSPHRNGHLTLQVKDQTTTGNTVRQITVGSNLGETPSEVQRVGTPSKDRNRPNSAATSPSGRPMTAPSIPSPARHRFGLPVRDVDRIVAVREQLAAEEGEKSVAGASTALALTEGPTKSRTKRVQPRVAVSAGGGALPSTQTHVSHRPVSAKNREVSNANEAIMLVPQLAALPVTSGGSFSQRLSAGYFTRKGTK